MSETVSCVIGATTAADAFPCASTRSNGGIFDGTVCHPLDVAWYAACSPPFSAVATMSPGQPEPSNDTTRIASGFVAGAKGGLNGSAVMSDHWSASNLDNRQLHLPSASSTRPSSAV